MKHTLSFAAALFLSLAGAASSQDTPKQLRAGIIGLDTSHVPAFTKLFNNPKADGDLAGIKVVVGYPGGTDMPASKDRVAKFTEQMRGMGVEIVDSIAKLLEKVDVVLIESVDGRIHLKEAREVFQSGKLVYIDKPIAGTLPEAIALFELAKKHHVKTWSSSSSRFGPELVAMKGNAEIGEILGVTTWGPCSYQSGTPDLFFYAIHGIESLFMLMGTGCETVARSKGVANDQVTGMWKDGRIGTYRGIVKGKAEFGAMVYGSKGVQQGAKAVSYEALCRQIGKFFRTGEPPVSEAETIEIFTFMEAADESQRQGGKPVALADVLAKAKEEAAKLVP
jgi:GFO/IDH/MocA oxidoreductase family protein